MTGAASEQGTTLRVCESEGCETVLSRFNSRPICAACEARIEIGGASIPRPRQPAYASRPPAPTRPTTEGAVPLPGVVKGRERTYAEMIAKPAAAVEASSSCAECGKALPANAEGWLCGDCGGKAVAKRGIVAASEHDKRAFQKPPANPSPKPPVVRTQGGHTRQFDWDDAAQRYRDGASHDTLARHFNVSKRSIAKAVRHVLGDDAAYAIGSTRQGGAKGGRKAGPRHRKFDWEAAARLYVDEQLTQTEIAERLGVNQRTVCEAIRRTLGDERAREISNARRGRKQATPASAPSIEEAKPEAPDPTPVGLPVEDPTPEPAPLDLTPAARPARDSPTPPRDHRRDLEIRIEQIKLLLDHNTHERHTLNDQARELLEEWGDINWRLSKLTDELAA